MSFDDYFKKLHESILHGNDSCDCLSSVSEDIIASTGLIRTVKESDNNLYIIGNGGSAAIASHVQKYLCKFAMYLAMVLNETSILTAYSNDISYEDAYKEHLSIWARDGDLLIAISSSGRSKNILKAAAFAKERGCKVITFSGFSPDNPLRLMGDINFYVRSDEYGIVETAHAIILHCITDIVKHES